MSWMRMPLKALAFFFVLSFVSVWAVGHFWRGETLSSTQAEKRGGRADLKVEEFRKGSFTVRAKMAAALLEAEKQYVGKSVSEIREIFGDPDGYYFSDAYPAYLVEVGKSRDQDSWQVVFLITKERRISGIILHKNCCD